MRARILAAVCFTLLAPAALLAASPTVHNDMSAARGALSAASTVTAHDDHGDDWRHRDDDRHCGRGNAWGCRRNRGDDRYDDRRDRRYDRARARDRYERDRYERDRYERDRYERDRYERDRYEQYYSRPVACLRAGSRVIGGVVVTVCLP